VTGIAQPQRLGLLQRRGLEGDRAAVVAADRHQAGGGVDRRDLAAGAVGDVLPFGPAVQVGTDEADPVAGVDPLTAAGGAVGHGDCGAGQFLGGVAVGLTQRVEDIHGVVVGVGDDRHPLQAPSLPVAVPGVHQLLHRRRPVGGQVQPAAGLQVAQRLGSVAVTDRPTDLPIL
jgi:hypothetical protein